MARVSTGCFATKKKFSSLQSPAALVESSGPVRSGHRFLNVIESRVLSLFTALTTIFEGIMMHLPNRYVCRIDHETFLLNKQHMRNENHFFERVPLTSGFLLGVLPLPLHLFLPLHLSYQLAAIALILIAGIYIGFAFNDGRPKIVLLEFFVALAFAGAAWSGLNGYPLLIVVALAVHGFWDLMHHKLIKTDIPHWYIPFCVICDWAMGIGLLLIWSFVH